MNLADTSEEAGFRADLRAWLAEHAADAPHLDPIPTEEQVVAWRAWSAFLYESGYAGITWPKEFGGGGRPPAFQAIWLEERARAGIPDHIGVIGLGMAGPTIVHWGSDEQRARHLAPLLRGDEIWCQGFSEPGSGSDLAAARTRAVVDGNEWVVNGQKVWSSFAHYADWCILLVRSDPSVAKHAGLSYLLVDMHAPGVRVVPLRQITGDPEFNEIFFDDVRVPVDSMLGAPGDGWKVAMTTLEHERGTHGIGLAADLDAELRAAAERLRQPGPDGVAPLDDPVVFDQLAEIWVELHALRVANMRTLSALARTGSPGAEATIAKLHWSELHQRLLALVGETLGVPALVEGAAGPDGGRWSFARLRARGNSIEAGTSEILRNIIAERVLALPRSR